MITRRVNQTDVGLELILKWAVLASTTIPEIAQRRNSKIVSLTLVL